ncbi:hypothetical protein FBU59_001206, partial [Linderina macrospora]
MSLSGKLAAATVSKTRFTTNLTSSAARAISAAAAVPSVKATGQYRGKSGAFTASVSKTTFT